MAKIKNGMKHNKYAITSAMLILFLWAFISVLNPRQSFATEKEIEKLLSLPEEKIDIGIASLTVAKDIFPSIDVNTYSAKIDVMVSNARNLTKGRTDPDYRIRALNTYLFKVEGIKYDFSDPEGRNPKTRYLNGILDAKKGNCVSMPLLYLAIAQRLGYPVYAVAAPEHYFLRYVDANLKEQNIEATSGGSSAPDEKYIRDFQISEKGIKSGTYLKTMTNRELLADMVSQSAAYWLNKGDTKRAIRYLEHCVKISPNSAEINSNLGFVYKERAKELGVVNLPREEYIKQIKQKAIEESKGGKQ